MVCSKCHRNGHNARTCSSAPPVALTAAAHPPSPVPAPPPPLPVAAPVPLPVSGSDSSPPVRTIKRPVTARPPVTEQAINVQASVEEPLSKREQEIKQLVDAVQRQPLNTDWKELAEQFGRPENYLRVLYNEAVSPAEHIRRSISCMTEEVIQDLLQTTGFVCTSCNRHLYSVPRQWEDMTYCDECHTELFRNKITERWQQVNQYATTTGKDRCNICEIRAVYNKEMGNRFHFDHLNMFEKADSICVMVQTGCPLEDIHQEIDRCQILCVSCHRLVTDLERRSGFMRLKNNMTRENKKTGDDARHQQEKEENMRIYSTFMEQIYSLLRQNLQKRPSPPVPLTHAICTDADEQ